MESRVLIVSIKPEYANKIFSGDKTIELRKCVPSAKKGDKIIIYVTDPVKAIKAIGTIQDIVKGTPNVIWKKYNKGTGISRKTFFDYYSNTYTAVGILLSDICMLDTELKLEQIRQLIPKFTPPQTFKYYSEVEFSRKFKLMQKQVA